MDSNMKLVTLYIKCLESNYVDITDENQKLKVKVFAMDLGLKYRKIEDLFLQAKEAYEQFQEENKKAARIKAQQEQTEKKLAQMQDRAKLAFTITTAQGVVVEVYRCEDGSVFCKEKGENKRYTNVSVNVDSNNVIHYQYHPSKTVFTGASSGGIAMGGFHETQAYYTTNQIKTGKGTVNFVYGDSNAIIQTVRLAPTIAVRFKRDTNYKTLFENHTVVCYNSMNSSPFMDVAMSAADFAKRTEYLSMAMSDAAIPFSDCVIVADILNSIIRNNLPKQDEELYKQAIEVSKIKDLSHLEEAINRFRYIIDYKDSKKYLDEITSEYEVLLQEAKEQKVLKREADSKKRKIALCITIPILAVVVVCVSILIHNINKNSCYETAISYLENGQFEMAIDEFNELGTYKDSEQYLEQAKNGMYEEAIQLAKQGDYTSACSMLDELSDYKNSSEVAENIRTEINEFNEIITAENITDAVIKRAKDMVENNEYVFDDFLEEKVYLFDSLCDTKWKYSSGDVKTISVVAKVKKDYRTITTTVYREGGWAVESVNIYDGSNRVLGLGISQGSHYSYDKTSNAITIKETCYVDGDVTLTLKSSDKLEIKVEDKNGKVYKCTYSKVE